MWAYEDFHNQFVTTHQREPTEEDWLDYLDHEMLKAEAQWEANKEEQSLTQEEESS